MKQYLELLEDVLTNGKKGTNRTDTNAISVFGRQLRFNIQTYFPLFTTRKISFRTVVNETLWFLSGSTNTNNLKSKIWDKWANENGELGPIYGKQWRDFNGIDQIKRVQLSLRINSYSRRHIISAWNPEFLPYEHLSPQQNVNLGKMSLAPCHTLFQFNVRDKYLDCHVNIRSNDLFIGMPHNVAGYALLTYMFAKICNYQPGELVYTIGDAHIYENHVPQIKELLKRTPLKNPKLFVERVTDIDDYRLKHFTLVGYKHCGKLTGDLAV